MYGNVAPEGCVGKITGKEGLLYEGVARCFDSEEDMLDALSDDPNSFKVQQSLAQNPTWLVAYNMCLLLHRTSCAC